MEIYEMLRSSRMENISWAKRVQNEELLSRVKEEKNILYTI